MYERSSCCGGTLGQVPNGEDDQHWYDTLIGIGQTVVDTWNSLFGGGDPSQPDWCWSGYHTHPYIQQCPDTPDWDAVLRAVTRAPDSEIQRLIAYMHQIVPGTPAPRHRKALMRPECLPYWVTTLVGGKTDCMVQYPEAKAWFLDFVVKYGKPELGEDYIGSGIDVAKAAAGGLLPFILGAGLVLALSRQKGGA
jgi:hypothetical protein